MTKINSYECDGCGKRTDDLWGWLEHDWNHHCPDCTTDEMLLEEALDELSGNHLGNSNIANLIRIRLGEKND